MREAHLHVFASGERPQQIMRLEDEADSLAHLDPVPRAGAAQLDGPNLDASGLRRTQRARQSQKRGLTGAGRAHDDHDFARIEIQVDMAQDLAPRLAFAVGVAEVSDGDERFGMHGG